MCRTRALSYVQASSATMYAAMIRKDLSSAALSNSYTGAAARLSNHAKTKLANQTQQFRKKRVSQSIMKTILFLLHEPPSDKVIAKSRTNTGCKVSLLDAATAHWDV